jgi:phage shock protein PspC (stress-responsive transcriptional regulator)
MEGALWAIAGVLGLALLVGLMLLGTHRSDASAGTTIGLRGVARARSGGHLGHVCVGLGKHTAFPVWLWRFVFVTLLLAGGAGFISYVVLWIVLPVEERDEGAA